MPIGRGKATGTIFGIQVKGLQGGHSGTEIGKQRGNALKIIARILMDISSITEYSLISVRGGTKDNAIPDEAEAVISVDWQEVPFIIKVAPIVNTIYQEYGDLEPDINITVEENQIKSVRAMKQVDATNLINLLHILPFGVARMCPTLPDLVQTSNNIVFLTAEQKEARITC